MGFFSFGIQRATAFSGLGAGTTDFPYRITTCAQLQGINENLNSNYVLLNDINCNGVNFTPIGMRESGSVSDFYGTLDGYNHTISNLTISISGPYNYVGLFGSISSGGIVKNLKITMASISSTNASSAYIGGLAGSLTDTTVSHVSFSGNVSGSMSVGGFAGNGSRVTIESSSVESGSIITET